MVTQVEDRKGHDRRYSLDDSLLRGMGYAPRIPFGEGLRATVRWYAGQPRVVGTAEAAHTVTGERSGHGSWVGGGEPRRWLVTGSGGMLGPDLVAALAGDGADVIGPDPPELDVTDEAAVARGAAPTAGPTWW